MKRLAVIFIGAELLGADLGLYPAAPWAAENLMKLASSNAFETLIYLARWVDSAVPATNFKTGASAPTWGNFTDANIQVLQFSKTLNNQIFGSVQLFHNYIEGTDVTPHMHVVFPTAAVGTASTNVWTLAYSWANIGGVFPASTTISITNSSARSAFQQAILDFGTISGTNKLISSVMCFSITRNGGNAYDIYDDVIDLISFDLHHQVNDVGSKNETSR